MHDQNHTPTSPSEVNEADRLDQQTPVTPEPEDEAGVLGHLPTDADPADAVEQYRLIPLDDEEEYPYSS